MQSEIILNDRDAHSAYSNFARVTATPEEVILDFALNPNPFVQGRHEVKITQRLIMNFFTAKRLCRALVATLAADRSLVRLRSNSTCSAASRERKVRAAHMQKGQAVPCKQSEPAQRSGVSGDYRFSAALRAGSDIGTRGATQRNDCIPARAM